MNSGFREYLLKVTGATDCTEITIIQSLWGGYGTISRFELTGSDLKSVVIKNIQFEKANSHPRGWNTDRSHQRKVFSYEVENTWYAKWSDQCHSGCRIPALIGSFSIGQNQWIVLEDLHLEFPIIRTEVDHVAIRSCLKWLANFHSTFLHTHPEGLWGIGSYWHLATRPDEWKEIENRELKSKAHLIDQKLNECHFKTIIHGDAKLANFCFSNTGRKVAAVDFQYVGGGCGMKDVIYFFTSCLSAKDSERFEDEFLSYYFQELQEAMNMTGRALEFPSLEKEWREMYFFAYADFTRFLLGWMPSHQKLNRYTSAILRKVMDIL